MQAGMANVEESEARALRSESKSLREEVNRLRDEKVIILLCTISLFCTNSL